MVELNAVPMTCCGSECFESTFNERRARKQLRRYRKRGPDKTTRMLVDALRAAGVNDASLLDIGAGIGVVHHELLGRGARSAIHVDAVRPHIRLAEEEASRRGHAERVTFLQGDFVGLAVGIPAADVVTLDRVICCYHDMEGLVGRSAAKARRLYGAVYPRELRWMRIGMAVINVVQRVKRSPFRVFLHSPSAIDAVLRTAGLERRSTRRTLGWEVVVYERR